ncbi:MAG: hypothetical protein ACPGO5_02160 [Patescibacteria group bacterium]
MVEASQLLEEADKLRNSQGNLSGALEKIGTVLDFDKKNTSVLLQKAIIERDLGKLQQANETVKDILTLATEENAAHVTAKRIRAELSLMKGDIETAREYASMAVDSARRLGQPEIIASALVVAGNVFFLAESLDEAREAFEEAKQLAADAHFSERLASAEICIACLESDIDTQRKALDDLLERSASRWLAVWFDAVIARLSIDNEVNSDVLSTAKKAYQRAADNGWVYYQARLAQQLARLLQADSPDVAVEYKKTADQLFEKLHTS